MWEELTETPGCWSGHTGHWVGRTGNPEPGTVGGALGEGTGNPEGVTARGALGVISQRTEDATVHAVQALSHPHFRTGAFLPRLFFKD